MQTAGFSMLELAQLSSFTTAAGTIDLAVGLPLQRACGLSTRAIIITASWLGSLLAVSWALLPFAEGQGSLVVWLVFGDALVSADTHVLAPVIRSLFTALSLSGEVQAPVAVMLGAMASYQAMVRLWAPPLGNAIYAWLVARDAAGLGYYVATGFALISAAVVSSLPPLDGIERKAAAEGAANEAAQLEAAPFGSTQNTITIRRRRQQRRSPLPADRPAGARCCDTLLFRSLPLLLLCSTFDNRPVYNTTARGRSAGSKIRYRTGGSITGSSGYHLPGHPPPPPLHRAPAAAAAAATLRCSGADLGVSVGVDSWSLEQFTAAGTSSSTAWTVSQLGLGRCARSSSAIAYLACPEGDNTAHGAAALAGSLLPPRVFAVLLTLR